MTEERKKTIPSGCVACVITPFEEDGRLDVFALERILAHLRAGGVSGVALCCSGQEGRSLCREEYGIAVAVACSCLGGKLSVVPCCQALSTKEAVAMGALAYEKGADALFCPPPVGFSSACQGYFSHLRALSNAVPLPLIAARSGGRSALCLCPEQLTLCGVKGVGEFGNCLLESALLRREIGKTPVFCTNDALLYPSLALGFQGAFSPLACLYPRELSMLFDLVGRGKREKALLLFEALAPLCAMTEGRDGGVLIKWALHRKGFCLPTVRLPLTLPEGRILADFERACATFEREYRLLFEGGRSRR